ncbi:MULTISPECIES: hypothetical protein [unclassified Saccharibacter]|uniref:hypothetical protein n=1 Tax=unclassified Saccharibacter TaxID=2648722 RepID=UPI001328119D|nr:MULTISPECIES: hypothetical protein [unclassified Saccharibacter]MXV35137.1 hypothetical protein [Saccharibacter sp. EH611]MXV57316.1 hypothetical protein [Saccharibacter sp. EH70]MXV64823.1 hypothetical protein [Saccharibacter sp. EH60]
MKRAALAFILSFPLIATGCSTPHSTHHPGLSDDGYGFVKDGPVLGPPSHLLTPAKEKAS